MKIVHLISGGDIGGAKSHVLLLLGGLLKTEHVQLICFTDGDFANDARKLNIPVKIIHSGNILKDLKMLTSYIKSEKFDIIHCHGSRANMMGAMLKFKLHIPTITTVHSDYRLDYMGRPISNLIYGTINKIALRVIDYHIGISEFMVNLLAKRGFNKNKMFALYNGIDFTELAPNLTKEQFLNNIGVEYNENNVIFGICARISPVKDMTTLINAFSLAVKKYPNIRLLIAGDGEEADKIKELAEKICPVGSVVFTGWITDTDSFYNALDVNLLTSLSETFPYSLTEGANMHCATIASRVGGIPYLIENGVTGLLFTAGRYKSLAAHMILLASDSNMRKTLADSLYNKAKKDFSLKATISKQKEIYRQILDKRD